MSKPYFMQDDAKLLLAISTFVRRQTKSSQFSHWTLSDQELLRRVEGAIICGDYRDGYKPGVALVSVKPDGFFTNVVRLKEGDRFGGVYAPRKSNESPRKQTYVLNGEKMPAAAVEIVLYHKDVLAENDERTTDADWEIISINATPDTEPSPMSVGTLLANHFHVDGSNDGGTSTGMTAEELVVALKASYDYWKDKGNAGPSPVRDRETPRDVTELDGGPFLSDAMIDGACSLVHSIVGKIIKDGQIKLSYHDGDGGNINAKAFGMLVYIDSMRARIHQLEEAMGIARGEKRDGQN